ncbi:pilus assembly protein, partial [Klebsiella pneumoniae]|nr:pilus assembly protein [Klebsiella pneumoniae]
MEFALIAPLLLFLYITSFELTIGLSVSKRVTRTASTIADLVTQQSKVTTSDLQQMTSVANAVFTPYKPENLKIKVTGVT